MRSQTVSTQLQEIAQEASQHPEWVFTTLAHRIDVEFLYEAYTKLNKKGAPGLNKVTAADYRENLEQNLIDLHERLKGGRYKAPPVKRVWIEKENGKKRALGKKLLGSCLALQHSRVVLGVRRSLCNFVSGLIGGVMPCVK